MREAAPILFTINASERMRIDSSGNVGIGTTSPAGKLHIKGSGEILRLETTATTGSNYINFNDADENKAYVGLGSGADDSFSIALLKNSYLRFATNSSERMRIDSSGRLLYGLTSSTRETSLILQGNSNSYTTNPGTLEVRIGQVPSAQTTLGQINFGCTGDKIGGTISAIADNADWSSGSSHPTAIRFFTTPGSSTTQAERMRIDSSGNVGIGTTSPSDHLDVSHSANTAAGISITNTNNSQASAMAQLLIAGGDNSKGRLKIETNGAFHTIDEDSNGNLILEDNGTERMRIDSSGRLLVGGTDASVVHTNADDVVIGNTSASVAGLSIATSTSGYATLQFSDGAGNKNQGQIAYNHADNSLALTTDSSVRMTIDSSGKVGIGTSSPATPLHIKPASNMSQLLLEQNNATDGYALFQDGPNGGHLKFMRRISGSDTQTLLLRSDGGLCFGTDSAAANALEDYEEGTFTPVLKGTSGGGTLTSSSAAGSGGNYTKVGNKVHLSFYFANPTGSNPSGTLYFELPFSVASGNDYNGSGGCVTYTRNIFPETDRMFAVNAIAGTNKLYIARVSVGGQGETGYQTINNDSDLTSMLFKATVSYAAA